MSKFKNLLVFLSIFVFGYGSVFAVKEEVKLVVDARNDKDVFMNLVIKEGIKSQPLECDAIDFVKDKFWDGIKALIKSSHKLRQVLALLRDKTEEIRDFVNDNGGGIDSQMLQDVFDDLNEVASILKDKSENNMNVFQRAAFKQYFPEVVMYSLKNKKNKKGLVIDLFDSNKSLFYRVIKNLSEVGSYDDKKTISYKLKKEFEGDNFLKRLAVVEAMVVINDIIDHVGDGVVRSFRGTRGAPLPLLKDIMDGKVEDPVAPGGA